MKNLLRVPNQSTSGASIRRPLHLASLRLAAAIGFGLMALTLLAGSASAVGISLTPIGGTAQGTSGQVGDTLILGVDLTLDAGDYVTIVAPTLQWDLEGGNVLDVTAAYEESILVGHYQLNPLYAFGWQIGDVANDTTVGFTGTNTFIDPRTGPTFFAGFEQVTTVLDEDGILLDILSNGISGAGTYRMGTIEFLLSEVGTTEISYYTNPQSAWRSFITGSNAVELPDSQVALNPLSVSASDLATLRINVVPEPGTGLLIGLGLAGLASSRRRSQPVP